MMLGQDELHELRNAAEKSWDDDTRHPAFQGHPQPSAGQSGVVSAWLARKLGGHVATKNGHFFWLSPDQKYALDLTGSKFAYPPFDKRIEGLKIHPEDEGLQISDEQSKWRPGPVVFKHSDHPFFKGARVVEPLQGERVERFIRRANHHFDNPHEMTKTADWSTPAFLGDSPQATEDYNQRYWDDDIGEPANGEYNFVYSGDSIEVSPFHSHDDLLSHIRVTPEYRGPLAIGNIQLLNGTAFWSATGNVSPKALIKPLKDYTSAVGWSFGGLTNIDGSPINDELFMGKSSGRIYFACSNDTDLVIAHRKGLLSKFESAQIIGYLDLHNRYAKVQTLKLPTFRLSKRDKAMEQMRTVGAGLLEWCQDNGYILLGANDNVIKTIEDIDTKNIYDPNPVDDPDPQYPGLLDNGTFPDDIHSEYACPECGKLFGSYSDMLSHTLQEEGEYPTVGETPSTDSDFPPIPDSILDNPTPSPHYKDKDDFTTTGSICPAMGYDTRQVLKYFGKEFDGHGYRYLIAYRGGPTASLGINPYGKVSRMYGKQSDIQWLLAKLAFENQRAPRSNLAGPIPFIYDIQDDTITMGQPNTRISDIPGKFSPGGIVDGMYEPDGKVIIRTFTNMPYSAHHLIQLWYAYNPSLEVKSLHLRDDAGGDTRLATWREF